MCIAVQTPSTRLLVDPGASLGPHRHGYRPHPEEYRALKQRSNAILHHADQADGLVITHYHFDHYIPSFENYRYNWSSEARAERLFEGKRVFGKHTEKDINYSQKKRAYYVEQLCEDVADELVAADGTEAALGDLSLTFSGPVPHGPEGTKLGYVIMVGIEHGDRCVVYCSDVQGPVAQDALEWVLAQQPDEVIVDGPPSYLVPSKFERKDLESAQDNMVELAGAADLIVDHHLMRSQDYEAFLEPVCEAAEEVGNTVQTYAEIRGEDNSFLEARREQLHEDDPVDDAFYERVEEGYYVDHELP
ncbi:MAG: MBL fold metallo-hydrolase [Candidatus Nanohaloarchaea archaeon]|nr:MBL fold metallo-hydrolase [Candidatus Nanohaloarchaea archaeon]